MRISFVMPWFRKMDLFRKSLPVNAAMFGQPECEIVLVLDEPSQEGEVLELVRSNKQLNFRVIVNDDDHVWRPPCRAINVGIRWSLGRWVAVLSPETYVVLPSPDFLPGLTEYFKAVFYQGVLNYNGEMFTCGYGFMLAPKDAYYQVCGYDEARQKYGAEDDDIRGRLERVGYEQCRRADIRLLHEPHPDHPSSAPPVEGEAEPRADRLKPYDWGRSFKRVAWDWMAFEESS